MQEKEYEGTPFRYPLVWREFRGGHPMSDDNRIQRVLARCKKVVRRIPLYQLNSSDPQKEILAAQEVFREFDNYPHLHIPHFDIIRGAAGLDDHHKPYLFIVDLIKGPNLARKKFTRKERPKAREILSNFLISLVDYTRDKYVYGGTYPSDQFYAQYVYGKAPNDLEDNVYFVDLDLLFNSCDPYDLDPKSRKNEVYFNLMVPFAGFFINYLEMKLGNEPLVEARTRYLEFLDSMLDSSHPYASRIERFKDAVQGKKSWRG